MTKVYLNYPNSRVSLHGKPACSQVQMMGKPGQRLIQINPMTLSTELNHFIAKDYRFASQASLNDMWLELDFADPEFESAIVAYIHRIVAVHYQPFLGARVERHCS